MNRLAGHKASMKHEQQEDRVELQRRTSQPCTKGNGGVNLSGPHPVRHHRIKTQCSRNGSALEVLRLAVRILGDVTSRNVESGQTGKTAQDEEGEAEVVDGSAHADSKSDNCGSNTKGDLEGGVLGRL